MFIEAMELMYNCTCPSAEIVYTLPYTTFGICKGFITHRIINSNRETKIEQVLTDVRHHVIDVNHRAV